MPNSSSPIGRVRTICFLVLCLITRISGAAESELTPVVVQLKWLHQFQFAGFYAAIEKGFYQKAGFDVTLREAAPDINPIDEVVEGRADFGVANSELLLYRLQGAPVTAVAVMIQHSPLVLVSLAESEILSPQDLIDKRVMFPHGPYGANTIGILRKEGVLLSQIKQMPLSFNINDLVEHRVDAMVGYVTDLPYQLRKRQIAYNIMDPRSYGIDFYGDTLFTTENHAMSDTEEVARFREATIEGWRYAVDNPEEIIRLLQGKYNSRKEYDELVYEARETIDLIVPKLVEVGHMNPGRWRHIADTFVALDMAPKDYRLEGFVFEPDRNDARLVLHTALWIGGLVVIAGAVGIFLLVTFNNRLKNRVELHTHQLREANEALYEQTQTLIEKEQALYKLNHALEARVEERTEALAQANQELKLEIAEREQRELSLRLLSKAVDSSRSGVIITNADGIIVYVNNAFLAMSGYDRMQVFDKHISSLEERVCFPRLDQINFRELPEPMIRDELHCYDASRNQYWVQISIFPIYEQAARNYGVFRPAPEKVSHYVVTCEDITLLKKSKDEMEQLAFYDHLTGLESRLLFKLRLENAITRAVRDKSMIALMFIDIDHFKEINDNYGHDAGDEVLKTVAARIKQNVRKNDTVARISGDEFTVILSDIRGHADARRVAQGIRRTLNQPFKFAGKEYFVGASIGISIAPDDGVELDELLKNADTAMYQAKRNGRNDIQFFSHSMNEEAKKKQALEAEMIQGLSKKQFRLDYQPVIDLETKKLVGLEALLRWNHPSQGIVYPDHFIPLAEETGLIVELGKWVISEVISATQELRKMGFADVGVAINVSARQLRDKGLIADIGRIVAAHRNEPCNIQLELTESTIIEELEQSNRSINDLNRLGFGITVDDFGAGYSSMSNLKQLPIDCIKIDKSFIHNMLRKGDDAEIVKAMISMAHNLKLKVVAVGVEDAEQVKFLKENQCFLAQGFYFSKAADLHEIIGKFSAPNVVKLTP
ncbi:EAL domain-containing protein [Hahella sp. NBU794]|uniref:EAL domain-containing protein n=1 Tax=Hahella sp. NBU794 TaxID=3422590 RepID=UPI003D6E4875